MYKKDIFCQNIVICRDFLEIFFIIFEIRFSTSVTISFIIDIKYVSLDVFIKSF